MTHVDELPPPYDGEGPSAATRRHIREAVMADLRPVRSRSLAARGALVFAATVAAAALAIASYGQHGVAGLDNHGAVVVVLAVAAVATVTIASTFADGVQRLMTRHNRGILVAAVLVVWSVLIWSGVSAHRLDTALAGPAIGCGVRASIAGALAAAAMFWIWRRADPWTPRSTGALIGAFAGCVSSAAVGVACVGSHGGHLLVGHWLAVPLMTLCCALLARRVLAP